MGNRPAQFTNGLVWLDSRQQAADGLVASSVSRRIRSDCSGISSRQAQHVHAKSAGKGVGSPNRHACRGVGQVGATSQGRRDDDIRHAGADPAEQSELGSEQRGVR
jgi:hypothetical protein